MTPLCCEWVNMEQVVKGHRFTCSTFSLCPPPAHANNLGQLLTSLRTRTKTCSRASRAGRCVRGVGFTAGCSCSNVLCVSALRSLKGHRSLEDRALCWAPALGVFPSEVFLRMSDGLGLEALKGCNLSPPLIRASDSPDSPDSSRLPRLLTTPPTPHDSPDSPDSSRLPTTPPTPHDSPDSPDSSRLPRLLTTPHDSPDSPDSSRLLTTPPTPHDSPDSSRLPRLLPTPPTPPTPHDSSDSPDSSRLPRLPRLPRLLTTPPTPHDSSRLPRLPRLLTTPPTPHDSPDSPCDDQPALGSE
ncbi:unnamed protein product [Arctogadus glacialis]